MQSSFTGTKDELWFFKIHLQLEIKSAPGIRVCVISSFCSFELVDFNDKRSEWRYDWFTSIKKS